MRRLLAALICLATVTSVPAQSVFETDSKFRARELQMLRDGETKFSQTLSEFNKLLNENPARGTAARTRLQQMAFDLHHSASELKSRFDFAWRVPQNRPELSALNKPWEKFLNEPSPAVRDLIREGRELARTSPGPVRGPTPTGEADIDLDALSRDIGIRLGPPVSRSGPDGSPIPPAPQTPAPPPSSSGNVYFAVLAQAFRTSEDEWKVPECRFRVIQKTRTNYGSRNEAEGDALRMRSQGYSDAEARYFDSYQAMDAFMRDWAQRRTADSRVCSESYARARGKATRKLPAGSALSFVSSNFLPHPSLRASDHYGRVENRRSRSAPIISFQDPLRLARSRPGELTYGTAGTAGGQHLATEMLSQLAKVNLIHVPYQGIAPLNVAAVGGHVSVAVTNVPDAAPYVTAGRLRAIAVTSASRSPALKDVPAVAELGFPAYDMQLWIGAVMLRATPREAVNRLSAEIVRGLEQQEMKDAFDKLGLNPAPLNPERFEAFIRAEIQQNEKIARQADIRIE